MLPYQKILEISTEKASVSPLDFEERVKKKVELLSGLVSKEGAAHIVANELGVSLRESTSGEMPIGKLSPDMHELIVTGKVLQLYPAKEFDTNGRKGKVGSVVIGDETGKIRVTFWNEKTDVLSAMKEGDVIKIGSAYTREGRMGTEMHVNQRSEVQVNPQRVTVEVKDTYEAERTSLEKLSATTPHVEAVGVIVQTYEPHFYEVCPSCGKRARMHNEEVVCQEHGVVKPKYNYVLNAMLDDGTDIVRLVCFGEHAEDLLEISETDMRNIQTNQAQFETMRQAVLGKIVCVQGRINKNEMFNRFELIAQHIREAKPEEELAKLVTAA